MRVNWEQGRAVRGASTITQQLAKNLYLTPSRSPLRKLRELIIGAPPRGGPAQGANFRNLSERDRVGRWDLGCRGSRPNLLCLASGLNAEQAALAGAIINPRVLNPSRPNTRLFRRQKLILSRMGEVTPRHPAHRSVPVTSPPDLTPSNLSIAPAAGEESIEEEITVEPSAPPSSTPEPQPFPTLRHHSRNCRALTCSVRTILENDKLLSGVRERRADNAIIDAARSQRQLKRARKNCAEGRASPRGEDLVRRILVRRRIAMINYTDHLFLLMKDIVARVPTLSFIDMKRVLVLRARAARPPRARTPRATASAFRQASLVTTTGEIATRVISRVDPSGSSPSRRVDVEGDSIDYMVSFALPRFCDQMLARSRKQLHYKDSQTGWPSWTRSSTSCITSIRSVPAFDAWSARTALFGELPRRSILCGRRGDGESVSRSQPDPQVRFPAAQLRRPDAEQYGGVAGTTFRAFPSYPQRYTEVLQPQPAAPPDVDCRVEPLRVPRDDRAHGRRSDHETVPSDHHTPRNRRLPRRLTTSESFVVSGFRRTLPISVRSVRLQPDCDHGHQDTVFVCAVALTMLPSSRRHARGTSVG